MASLALHLKYHYKRPSRTLLITTTSNLTSTHLFSSSYSSDNNKNVNNNDDENASEKQYPFSGYFKDIKSKLKQHEEQRQQHSSGFRPFNSTPRDSSNPSKVNSFDEIKKNLSEFRRRSSEFPSSQQQPQPNMFQNVRSQNVGNPNSSTGAQNKTGNLSFDAIRESLRQMKGGAGRKDGNMSDTMSLNAYKKSLKMQPTMAGSGGVNKVIGGSPENLPLDVFGKELREKEMKKGEAEVGGNGDNMLNIELAKLYTYDDLGEKLRELRPEIKEKKGGEANWFSLRELNERVKKLKEIEEKQFSERIGGSAYGDLRRSLKSLKEGSDKSKTTSMQGIKILPQPRVVSSPKEHLVERYFHPDNMSAEEKLKLKLKTVRDEFKMHESDCGSVRVQIAQLTTEILHLSSVLHKKDKHSRRGLQAKVQQRKKLLKYLRRTDWESYSFVLSKLGLRDNPDYKN